MKIFAYLLFAGVVAGLLHPALGQSLAIPKDFVPVDPLGLNSFETAPVFSQTDRVNHVDGETPEIRGAELSVPTAGIISVPNSSLETLSQFQLSVGGTDKDWAFSTIQAADGGYAMAGNTTSFGAGGTDLYIVKVDAGGSLQWTRTVGGPDGDTCGSIIQTTDDGYVVAGVTRSYGAGLGDVYVVKLDANGTVQWTTTIGGADDEWYVYSIVQTTDGGYAIAGNTDSFGAGGSDMYICKLDGSGSVQWTKTVGGTGGDVAQFIVQTIDGGYAVGGYSSSFGAGGVDMCLVRLDASGDFQWARTVGGTGNDYARSGIQTIDGGYAVVGYTNSLGAGGADMYVAKFGSSGSLQWTRTVGGTGADAGWSVIQLADGSYVIGGQTSSFGAGGHDAYIVKLKTSGGLQWSRTVGGTINEYGWSIIRTFDGGYAIGGVSYVDFDYGGADMYMAKFTGNWKTCGNAGTYRSTSGTGGTTTSPVMMVSSPPSVIMAPSATAGSGGTLTTICGQSGYRLEPQGMEGEANLEEGRDVPPDAVNTRVSTYGEDMQTETVRVGMSLHGVYPNPARDVFRVAFALGWEGPASLDFFDAGGRCVLRKDLAGRRAGEQSVEIGSEEKLPAGIYRVRLSQGGRSRVTTVVIMR